MALSMLVPSVYSSMIMLEFSPETDSRLLRPLEVPRARSMGAVTSCSTFSGLAPG